MAITLSRTGEKGYRDAGNHKENHQPRPIPVYLAEQLVQRVHQEKKTDMTDETADESQAEHDAGFLDPIYCFLNGAAYKEVFVYVFHAKKTEHRYRQIPQAGDPRRFFLRPLISPCLAFYRSCVFETLEVNSIV